jgi:hypothetical protein
LWDPLRGADYLSLGLGEPSLGLGQFLFLFRAIELAIANPLHAPLFEFIASAEDVVMPATHFLLPAAPLLVEPIESAVNFLIDAAKSVLGLGLKDTQRRCQITEGSDGCHTSGFRHERTSPTAGLCLTTSGHHRKG